MAIYKLTIDETNKFFQVADFIMKDASMITNIVVAYTNTNKKVHRRTQSADM